ncbi:MAG TPA: hypothetical protein VIY08_05520 [Candidatus Nitrosocosmicus sp.]
MPGPFNTNKVIIDFQYSGPSLSEDVEAIPLLRPMMTDRTRVVFFEQQFPSTSCSRYIENSIDRFSVWNY